MDSSVNTYTPVTPEAHTAERGDEGDEYYHEYSPSHSPPPTPTPIAEDDDSRTSPSTTPIPFDEDENPTSPPPTPAPVDEDEMSAAASEGSTDNDNTTTQHDPVIMQPDDREAEALTINPHLSFFDDPSQLPHSTVNDYLNRIGVDSDFSEEMTHAFTLCTDNQCRIGFCYNMNFS